MIELEHYIFLVAAIMIAILQSHVKAELYSSRIADIESIDRLDSCFKCCAGCNIDQRLVYACDQFELQRNYALASADINFKLIQWIHRHSQASIIASQYVFTKC